MELWNPGVELMSRNEMQALQLEKLKRQLARVYAESPYYKSKFDKAKVDPAKLGSLDEIRHYPFFDKDEERASQEQSKEQFRHPLGMHITCDPKKVIRISSTSGTTGSPTFTGYTQKDREAVNETGSRCLWRMGARPGDVVMHAFVLSMWIAGTPVVDLIQNYGATVVPIGARSGLPRFAQIAQEVFPKMLICTPSYAEYLIDNLPEKAGVDAKDLGIERIMVAGEPGAGIPRVRERIEQGFGGATIYDTIGATGAVFLAACSSETYEGMHFVAEDYCLVEIVDPKTLEALPFADGVEGEIVYTGLEKECAPLIRWRDKDIVQVFTEPAKSGLPGFRFIIKGRADDMLLVRGVNVYPHAIKDVIASLAPRVTGLFKIVLDAPPPVVEPPLELRVEIAGGEDEAGVARDIEERIHELLRFRARVETVSAGTFEGTHHKTALFERRYEG
ncbi:MAG: AMP-binding protein [Acidobacteriota bacterium]|nr:MAG: AMP-binding protein [Acidobacteriota bacterium]